MSIRLTRRRALMLASGVLPATLAFRSARSADAPFVVGAALPMSGPFSNYGELTERALKAGAARVNEAGGILGRKVELLVRDDAGNAGRTLLAVKELVGERKVDFLYPEQISGFALAVLPYTTEEKVLTITSATAPQVGDAAKFPYSFQYSETAPQRVPAVAQALVKFGGKRVGILVSTNPGTTPMGDGLADVLPKKYGMSVAGYRQFTADTKDFTPHLQALRDAGADIIAFDSVAQDGVRLVMTGMQSLGWTAKVICGPAALTRNLAEQVPEAVKGQFFAVNFRAGVKVPGAARPGMDDLIAKLKAMGTIENLGLSAMNHDIVFLAKWAHETAQKEAGNTTSDTLRRILESVGGRSYPDSYWLFAGNPHYTAKDHSMANADASKLYGLIGVSAPVDGAYAGEALDIV